MAVSRYKGTAVMDMGRRLGTPHAVRTIRSLVNNGQMRYVEYTMTERDRLDTVAGTAYGDGQYWWVLAAASNVGWGLQVPPGTVIRMPDLNDVLRVVG